MKRLSDETNLRILSERITRSVCDIHLGWAPTRDQLNERDRLRNRLGMDWDAINQRWTPYDPTD